MKAAVLRAVDFLQRDRWMLVVIIEYLAFAH
jgi:hypothetical protein